jgi:holo-[acyl-carrier protein] synthase
MSVVGIGIDMVDVGRMAVAIDRGGERFSRRVFTEGELLQAKGKPDRARRLALCFAAKEALFKAMGTGWPRGGRFTDVELHHDAGAPRLDVTGAARDILDGRRVREIAVTTSWEGNLALCFVLLLR